MPFMPKLNHTLPALAISVMSQSALAQIVTQPDAATMTQNQGSVTIPVLANDSSEIAYDLIIYDHDTDSAAYGTVVLNQDNTLTYTPDEGFTGEDVFYYRAVLDDGYGDTISEREQVTVTVLANGSPDPDPTPDPDPEIPDPGFGVLGSEQYRRLAEAATQQHLLNDYARTKTGRLYRSMALLRSHPQTGTLAINNQQMSLGGAAGDAFHSPWSLMTGVQYESSERKASTGATAYDARARGLMMGLAYRYSPEIHFGAAVDWTRYTVDYAQNGGGMESDLRGFTGFWSWQREALSLELQAGYTDGSSRAERQFADPTYTFAFSRYGSRQRLLSAQTEWTHQQGAWTLRPFARLDYTHNRVEDFEEEGNAAWLSHVERQYQENLHASLGIDYGYAMGYSWGVMVPSLRASAVNHTNLRAGPTQVHLVGALGEAGGTFQLESDSPESLFIQWEANTVFVLPGGLSGFLSAQTLSHHNYTRQYIFSGGFHWEF